MGKIKFSMSFVFFDPCVLSGTISRDVIIREYIKMADE